MTTTFTKDPAAMLDYQWDWSAWLAEGETIVEHAVTVSTGLTLASTTATDSAVTAWISGGTADRVATATCQITTSSGRVDERSIHLDIQTR